jgi:hypothetical protein
VSGEPFDEVPPDDPRWVRFSIVLYLRCQWTGSYVLAARDLTEVLEKEGVHSMQRFVSVCISPDWRLLSNPFWSKHDVVCDGEFLRVIPRPHSIKYGTASPVSQDGVFYAWLPDLERVWPAIFPPSKPSLLDQISERLERLEHLGHLVLLSQKVAANGEQNHLFGKIHTSAMGGWNGSAKIE